MPDMFDFASEAEQRERERALSAASRSAPVLPAVGSCYNCDSILPDGVRFCDSDCRNDYQRRKQAEARNA